MKATGTQTKPRRKWLRDYESYTPTVIEKPDGEVEIIRDPDQPVFIQPGLPDGLKRLIQSQLKQ